MEFSKVYSFILSPDVVIEKVRGLKSFCKQIIGEFKSEHSRAHITISEPCLQTPAVMANTCRRLIQDLIYIPAITLNINSFGYFENASGYVIYAKIELDEPTQNWFKILKSNFDKSGSFMPHITIARNLTLKQFEAIWPTFSCMIYRQSFLVDSVLILENEIVKTAPDQVFKKISLGSNNLLLRKPWTLFDNLGLK